MPGWLVLRMDKFLFQRVGRFKVNMDMTLTKDPPEFLRYSLNIRNDGVVPAPPLCLLQILWRFSTKFQFGSPQVWSAPLMCLCSFSFPSVFVGTVSARRFGVLITPSLCSGGRRELNSKYWSVSVCFLYTSVLRLLTLTKFFFLPTTYQVGLDFFLSNLTNLQPFDCVSNICVTTGHCVLFIVANLTIEPLFWSLSRVCTQHISAEPFTSKTAARGLGGASYFEA